MRILRAIHVALFGLGGRLALGDGLHWRASGTGRYFGTAMNGDVLTDKVMEPIVSSIGYFGQYTCEYQMTFAWTESHKNSFTYALADNVVAQAETYGMIMRCHSLVWHQSLPSWVTSAKWTNSTLLAVMKNHITNVVKHFKGKCYAWDVVNEALYTDGSYRGSYDSSSEESSIWYTTIGPAYIPIAFATASAADPSAKLYYNDYNIEVPTTQGDKIMGVHNLVAMLREYNAPIHGIGLEGHFSASNLPSVDDLVSGLQNFSSLGLEVAYTELDVQSPVSDPNRTGEAIGYASAVTACLQAASCVGWTVWGFTEKYSWLTESKPPAEGDLWDRLGVQNLAYDYTLTSLPTCWGWRCFSGNATTVSVISATQATPISVSASLVGAGSSSRVGLDVSNANGSFPAAAGNSSRTSGGQFVVNGNFAITRGNSSHTSLDTSVLNGSFVATGGNSSDTSPDMPALNGNTVAKKLRV